jgi:acetyltransferase-like isoleucine patch superfamily enzyme
MGLIDRARASLRYDAWRSMPPENRLQAYERLIGGGIVSVGKHSYGTPHVNVDCDVAGRPIGTARLFIGPYCSIADDVVVFLGNNHRPDWVSTFPFRIRWNLEGAYADGHPATRGDVRIGADVWVGEGATILSGVEIGPGAVIGATATVSKDVRPYAIVVGNPAREVRRRFDDTAVDRLLQVRWWDWSDEYVRQMVPVLCSSDVEALIACAPE